MPIIGGDLVRLRPVDMSYDIDLAVPWYQDPEVIRYSEGKDVKPYDRETVERMYAHLSGKGEFFIIEVLERNVWKPIGDAALTSDSLPIVIGDRNYRSRGIGRRS